MQLEKQSAQAPKASGRRTAATQKDAARRTLASSPAPQTDAPEQIQNETPVATSKQPRPEGVSLECSVERTAFLRVMERVVSVPERRNTIPILNHALLIVDDNGIELKASDMDIEITDRVAANVSATGKTAVGAHMLYDAAKRVSGDEIKFSMKADGRDNLTVSSGRSRYQFEAMNPEDFPLMPDDQAQARSFVMSAAALRRIFSKTRHAHSTESTRGYLNGAYLHPVELRQGEWKLRAVATDGYRLARADVPCPDGASSMPGVIVPTKIINLITKLVGDNDVAVNVTPSKIKFTFGDTTIISKLIDGSFPDYGRVIPNRKTSNIKATIKAADFAKGIDRVSSVWDSGGKAIGLSFRENLLILEGGETRANNQKAGYDELEIEYANAPVERYGFNPTYLLAMCAEADNPTIDMYMSGDISSPALFIDDSEDGNLLFVVMPMRV